MENTFDLLDKKSNGKYYMACLWPVIDLSKLDEVEKILQKYGEIVYSREIPLTYMGMKNFMVQIYGHQTWTGTIKNHFRGVRGKVDVCYKEGAPVRTYLFKADCLDVVLEAKEKIREIFKIEKSSIHISDNQTETENMMQLLYNKNSIDFINFANPYQSARLFNKLIEVKHFLEEKALDKNRFILGGDAIFELCGWKKIDNYKILTDYGENELSGMEKIIDIDFETQKYGCTISELLYNPMNFFSFEEMKFVTVQRVLQMNASLQNYEKVQMCEKIIEGITNPTSECPSKRIVKFYQLKDRWMKMAKSIFLRRKK